MQEVVLGTIVSSLLFSVFLYGIDDHTSGRGARQVLREAVNEKSSSQLDLSFSVIEI